MGGDPNVYPFIIGDASGSEPNTDNIPCNVGDNSPDTRWSHKLVGAYIALDLGEVKFPVRVIGIQWFCPKGHDGRKCKFSVEVSSDSTNNFQRVISDRESIGDKSMEYYQLDRDYDARYVKIIVNGNDRNEWASIVSVNVLDRMLPKPDPGFDRFGVRKIYPDAQQSRAVHQGEQGWVDQYTQHGYRRIPGVRIWRKTLHFSKNGFLNQEATIYLNVPRLNSEYYNHRPDIGPCASGSGLSIKLRGGHHSNSGDGSARCYVFHFEYEGNNNCMNFQKEYPHPDYKKVSIPAEFAAESWIGEGKWVGFKTVTINEGNGVLCESYIDYGGIINGKPANQWKKWYSVLDNGNVFTDDNHRPPYTRSNGNAIQFRMDNADRDTNARFASVREVKKR